MLEDCLEPSVCLHLQQEERVDEDNRAAFRQRISLGRPS